MNGSLGRPYRVFYTAKNIQSGLSGIVANVMRPDGSVLGPFTLLELANTNFSGIYYFDFLTTQLFPEGEYLVTVKEGSYKSPVKITFTLPSEMEVNVDSQKIIGTIKTSQKLKGIINNGISIVGRIKANRLIGSISPSGSINGLVRTLTLKAKIEPKKITGKIIC